MTLLHRARRILAVGIAGLALASLTPHAQAQFGLMGMGGEMADMVKPAHNARLLKEYARILALSPEQKRTAEELLVAYQTEFRDNVSRLEDIYRSVSEEVQETGDYELYQTALPNTLLKFMKKADTLNQTFMSDLQAILEPAQAARYPEVEQFQRRSTALKIGLEGIQRLDLYDLTAGLQLDAGTSSNLAPTLQQYGGEIERELTARDTMIRKFFEEMAKMLDEGKRPEEDPTIYQSWFKDLADSGKRIEGVNTRYLAQVRAALPEATQQRLDADVKVVKYPAIYRSSYAHRVFDAVDRMTDLDATQKEGLKTIKDTFVRDASASNDKWASVLDELKAAQGDEAAMFGGGMWMIRNDPKYTEARDARKALDDKTVESVKALLTEAQRAKLPKKNYRPEWDFERPAGE